LIARTLLIRRHHEAGVDDVDRRAALGEDSRHREQAELRLGRGAVRRPARREVGIVEAPVRAHQPGTNDDDLGRSVEQQAREQERREVVRREQQLEPFGGDLSLAAPRRRRGVQHERVDPLEAFAEARRERAHRRQRRQVRCHRQGVAGAGFGADLAGNSLGLGDVATDDDHSRSGARELH
jgi:hypothetical protein